MIKANAKPKLICDALRDESNDKVAIPRDIDNLRPRLLPKTDNVNWKMGFLGEYLRERRYEIRYQYDSLRQLKSLFFAHPTSIQKARSLYEVIIVDATYKTNIYKMPYINIVGIDIVGRKTLKTFAIAGAWVSDVKVEPYRWVADNLWSIFSDRTRIYPKLSPWILLPLRSVRLRVCLPSPSTYYVLFTSGTISRKIVAMVSRLRSSRAHWWQQSLRWLSRERKLNLRKHAMNLLKLHNSVEKHPQLLTISRGTCWKLGFYQWSILNMSHMIIRMLQKRNSGLEHTHPNCLILAPQRPTVLKVLMLSLKML